MNQLRTPHLDLHKGTPFQRVIVCGSPERAAQIADILDHSTALKKNREYHSYCGSYQNKQILVVSHGVGSAGAAICFNELFQIGAKSIIRVGTAGALSDGIEVADLVVPTSAVRLDGVSQLMVPLNFPAVPNYRLSNRLLNNLTTNFPDTKKGIIVTSDLFYPGLLDNQLEFYKKAGAIAVEMECSTLFICGHLNGVKTAAVLGIDGNPLKWNQGNYDPKSNKLSERVLGAARIAIETLVQEDYEAAN